MSASDIRYDIHALLHNNPKYMSTGSREKKCGKWKDYNSKRLFTQNV